MKADLNTSHFFEALTWFLMFLLGYSFFVPENSYQSYIDGFVIFYEIMGWVVVVFLLLLNSLVFGKEVDLNEKDVKLFLESKDKFLANRKKLKNKIRIRSLITWFFIFFIAVFIRDWSLVLVLVLWKMLASMLLSALFNATDSAIKKYEK